MSSPDFPRLTRLLLVLALAGLTAGCFQPLYGEQTVGGGSSVRDKMAAVDVAPVVASVGTRLPRVGGEVRNELIYQLTGGGEANTTSISARPTFKSSPT
jgi:LPS-assembly lipoprotein